MALTVNQAFLHAQAHIKAPSTYASAEEVRFANTVQSIITGYHPWHWLRTPGTDIPLVSGTQEYTLNASDQSKVLAVDEFYLKSGSTNFPELIIYSERAVPITDTQGRPWAVSLHTQNILRFYPTPDATYTGIWHYQARPVVFAANTETWQCPDAFDDVVKAGMIWQIFNYADDDRATAAQKTFYDLLMNYRRIEEKTIGSSL